jgi:cellulose synthase/poly-beta-1,6-N-acetylglucosamine synthase-like glycosyltransferase
MSYILVLFVGSFLILLTLPGSIELALLTIGGVMRQPQPGAKPKGATPALNKLAVIIPAHNEAAGIVRSVESIARCSRPGGKVTIRTVVVADNCNDATAMLAHRAGARVIVRADASHRGKGFALQYAFETLLAEGFDAFVVVDADTIVEPNLLVEIVTLLDAGADGVQVRYRVLNTDATVRTRLMSVALMAMNVLRPRARERWKLSVGLSGNGFALTRATLVNVPYDAHSVVEDLEYHLQIVRRGRRIAFADRATVLGEMPTDKRGVQTQRIRWEGGRLRMIQENVPALIREVATGKFQLLEPLLDLLLLPLGFHGALLACALLIPFTPARIYAVSALALLTFHVGSAVIVSGGDLFDFAAVLASPFYVVWKLALVPHTVKNARRDASWVRTRRNRTLAE